MFEVRKNNGWPFDRNDESNTAEELSEMLDENVYRIFVWLLRSPSFGCGYDHNSARHKSLCLPNFAHLSYCRTLALTARVRNSFDVIEDDGWKTVQRSVTAKSI